MNKYEVYLRKYCAVFDYITLTLCSLLVIKSVLDTSTLLVTDSFFKTEIVYDILMVLAIIKLYVSYDLSDTKYICAVCLFFLTIIFQQAGLPDMRQLVLPIVALYGVSFESVAKVFASSAGFGLTIILLLALSGNISIGTVARAEGTKLAYHLGFTHHSWFMMHWLFVMFAAIYIFRKNKFRIMIYLVLLIITAVLWIVTDSNTSGIIGVMVCVILLLDCVARMVIRPIRPFWRKAHTTALGAMVFLPVLSVLFTFLGCIYYGYFGYGPFSRNMMNRFKYALTALEALGVRLPFSVTDEIWDMPFNWFFGTGQIVLVDEYEIDNVYARLLIENGLIILICYLVLQMVVRYNLYRKKQYQLALMCTAVSVFGILESRAYTTFSCALLSMLIFARVPQVVRGRKNRYNRV